MSAKVSTFGHRGTTSSIRTEISRELVNATDGAGLHFDGAAGGINLGTSMPDLGTKYSLEFVVKGDSKTGETYLLDAYNSSSTNRIILAWSGSSNGNIQLHVNGTWSSAFIATPDNGEVLHLLLSVDGTSATLYQNGNSVSTQTVVANTLSGATNTHIGASQNGSGNFFNGTIYRARFYNKTLTSAEVQTAYERADVPFDDQWGQQQIITNANDRTFGGAVVNWTGQSGATIAVSSGELEIQFGTGASNFANLDNTGMELGRQYRVTLDIRSKAGDGDIPNVDIGHRPTDNRGGTNYFTVTATEAGATVTGVITVTNATASTRDFMVMMYSQNNKTVYIDNVQIDRIGCVSDYQTQWANPSQSLTVQDASGNADGTCSASGVTQVQPVVQLNSTSARIGTSAATPADGTIAADEFEIAEFKTSTNILESNVSGHTGARLRAAVSDVGTPTFSFHDDTDTGMYRVGADSLGFTTGGANRLTISSTGNVGLSVTPESAWAGGVAMQVGDGVSLFSPTGTDELDLTANAYYDGSDWKRISNNYTSRYEHTNGSHIFSSAGADAADSTISWATALTISSTGNCTFNSDDVLITSDTSGKPVLTIRNQYSDASGPELVLERDQSYEDNNDILGTVRFKGYNSSNVKEEYATIYAQSTNVADGAEDGQMIFRTMKDGTLDARLTIDGTGLATFSGGIAQGGTTGDDTADINTSGILNLRRASGVGRVHIAIFNDGNTVGTITSNASATQYNTSSDYRLKENLEPLTGALDRLDQLPVYRFNFTADPDTTVDGFVAHEVSAHVPEAVTGEKDAMKTVVVQEAVEAQPATYYEEGDELPEGKAVGDEKTPAVEAVAEVIEEQPDYQGIDQSKLVPLLVAAVKELKAKVETLENA